MYCDKCGQKLVEAQKFCTNCGNKIAIKSSSRNRPEPVSPVTVYLKSEPAGEICLGRLDDRQVQEVIDLLEDGEISESDYVYSAFNYANIAHVYGFGGRFDGSEIKSPKLSKGQCPIYEKESEASFPINDKGDIEDGIYLAFYSLSKISREFEFTPSDGLVFDPTKMTFLYTDIALDNKLLNDHIYGPAEWRFITGYLYNGEEIEEVVDADDVDRGLTTQLLIFQVKAGKLYRVYKNINGEDVLKSKIRD